MLTFLRDLARRARPFAERDLAELREFAARELGLPDLQAWDRPSPAEQLKQARYAFSSQEVKQYFTEPRVLEGLFQHRRDAVRAWPSAPDSAPVWHDSVRFYRIERGGEPRRPPSTSTPTPAPASGPAPGWTTCAAAGGAPTAQLQTAGGAPGVQLRAAGGRASRRC